MQKGSNNFKETIQYLTQDCPTPSEVLRSAVGWHFHPPLRGQLLNNASEADPMVGSLFFPNVTQINTVNIHIAPDIVKIKRKTFWIG